MNDGDKSLVVADEVVISAATRNMKGVVPLYYEMHKAKDCIVDHDKLYESMISAYTGGNIGEVSNCISKIENSDNPDWDLVKCLCRFNNEIIDYAKTLYKTPLTSTLEQKIKLYNNQKLPHFFIHAKNKSESQVCEINNSPVNRLNYIVKNPRFDFDETSTGKFNYRNLIRDHNVVFNPDNKLHTSIVNFYRSKINENRCLFNDADGENGNYAYVYQLIRNSMIDEFGEVGFIVDVLVDYFFGKVNSKRKNVLWGAFGDVIYENLKQNIDSDTFSCANCGERVEKVGGAKRNAQKYCAECSSDIQYYKPIKTKVLICVDCEKEFEVDARNMTKSRCNGCQINHRKKWDRERKSALKL